MVGGTVEAPTQDLLTVPEVMGLLHWSRPIVYRLINSGELRAIRTGTGKGRGQMIRIASGDLVTYLQRVNGEA